MLDILLCIVFSASLIVIFKIAGQRQVRTMPMIVINYWVAAICGFLLWEETPSAVYVLQAAWLPWALVLGVMFITVFNMIGVSTLRSGIAVTAIAQKMSLAIPILAAVFLFGESLSVVKILGILLALGSILLTTYKPKKLIEQDDLSLGKTSMSLALLLPLAVFFGSGSCDTVVTIINKKFLLPKDTDLLNTVLFLTASVAGTLALLVQVLRGKETLRWRQLGFGIILGVPNYFSLYFLIKALQRSGMESSVVFPMVNIGVVTTAAVVAYFGFKEHLTGLNILGIVLAIVAIYILAMV
jgi:multidrug transporter EmrE-like cation transporter